MQQASLLLALTLTSSCTTRAIPGAFDGNAAPHLDGDVQRDEKTWRADTATREMGVGDSSSCPATGITTLASGLEWPSAITVDAKNVYFTSGANVMSCAKCGCGGKPLTLATNQKNSFGLVSDGKNVYWTNFLNGTVMSCAVDGCGDNPTVLAGNQLQPQGLTIVGTTLYWVNRIAGIMKCSTACKNNPETVLWDDSGYLSAIVAGGSNLYWTDEGKQSSSGQVRTCSLNGACVPVTLAAKQNHAHAIAVDEDAVYWTADGDSSVRRCTLPGCFDVSSYPIAGQVGVAVDQKHVYWTYWALGSLFRCEKVGCVEPIKLATGQQALHIALDDDNVYWANEGGSIMKTSK